MITKISVFVADDHAIMRDGIRSLLSNYDDIEIVGEASDGKEAVSKVAELSPNIVIMDIGMAEMDGLEASRRIKRDNPKTRVLILSQHENREYLISALKAGVSGYIPKKAVGSDLIEAIRTIYNGNSFIYPTMTSVLIQDYLDNVESDPFDRLTSREREILKLIVDGYSSRQIAEQLYLSLKTIHGHRTRMMSKLNIHNKTDLALYAVKKGFVALNDTNQ